MAYDTRLAERVRELLADTPSVTEKKMFGGLGFLIAGKMAVAASGQGGLLVRVASADAEHLLDATHARPMEMNGRAVRGWLHVDSGQLRTRRKLAEWITIGTTAARKAPAKD